MGTRQDLTGEGVQPFNSIKIEDKIQRDGRTLSNGVLTVVRIKMNPKMQIFNISFKCSFPFLS